MDNNFSEVKDLGFASAVAQSRSIQGLVRVMGLFEKKYSGGCSLMLRQRTSEGLELDFSASSGSEVKGLEDFLEWLALTDRFMQLESILSWAADKKMDESLISELMNEAKIISQRLYPEVVMNKGAHD